MDFDTDQRFIAQTDYRKAINCRIALSDEGNQGIVENIRSNFRIDNTLINSDDICIGAYEDKDGDKIYFFIWAAPGGTHGIYSYDPLTQTTEVILQNSLLNFDRWHLITGVNVIGTDEDIFPEGLLYWTDDFNPPRKINIFKARTGGYSAVDFQVLDAIKYPPLKHPSISDFKTDISVENNQLKEKSWQFKYRWIYDDLEKSAWSPMSINVCDESFNPEFNPAGTVSYENNCIGVYFNTGHPIVQRIQIAVRNTNGTDDFVLVADIDKDNVNEMVTSSLPATFNGPSSLTLDTSLADNQNRWFIFYNDSVSSMVNVVESNKLYDNVPHLAKAQEVVDGNRLVYGNVESGQTVDKQIDTRLSPTHPVEASVGGVITDHILPNGEYQIFSQHYAGNSQGNRKWRGKAYIRWKFPDVSEGCRARYKIRMENFWFAGAYAHGTNSQASYCGFGSPYHHGFVISADIDYTSQQFSVYDTVPEMIDIMVNELNNSGSPIVEVVERHKSAGGTADRLQTVGYMDELNLHHYEFTNEVIGGENYLQLKIQTNGTMRYNWSTYMNQEIYSLDRQRWNAGGGICGNNCGIDGWRSQNNGNYGNGYITLGTDYTWIEQLYDFHWNPHGLVHMIGGQDIPEHHTWNSWCTWGAMGNIEHCGTDDYTGTSSWAIIHGKILRNYKYPGTNAKRTKIWGKGIGYTEPNWFWWRARHNEFLSGNHVSENLFLFEETCADTDFRKVVPSFKSGAKHRFGLVYYDRANRSSSVQLGKRSDVYIPKVAESTSADPLGWTGEWHVDWEIHHSPPDWATHYQWVYGGNMLTDNFIHFVCEGIYDGIHAVKDSGRTHATTSGETYAVPEGTYRDNLLVDITNIRRFARKYSGEVVHYDFVPGDILRFVLDETDQPCVNSPYEFKIVGVVGEGEFKHILASTEGENNTAGASGTWEQDDGIGGQPGQPKDFLLLSREVVLTEAAAGGPFQVDSTIDSGHNNPIYRGYNMEIYSPKKVPMEEHAMYYEFGHVGQIGLDYDGNKVHKRMSGSYKSQSFSTHPLSVWGASTGPATGRFTAGDVYYKYRTTTSQKLNTFVESFHYSDRFKSDYYDKGRPNAVLQDFKRVRKHSTCLYSDPYIPNTNINGLSSFYPDVAFAEFERSNNSIQKLHTRDNKLIIFQEDKVSASLVKRDIIYNVDATGNVATSDNVLSPAIPYAGNYGINKNPESFASFGNRMYFADIRRGCVIRLSQDGFTKISEYKMKEYFTDKCTHIYNSISHDHHPYFVYGAYDSRFSEYIISFSEHIHGNPYSGYAPIYAETLGFCEDINKWSSFYSYQPEYMCSIATNLCTFKDGHIYSHNHEGAGSGYNNFYGVDYPSDLWIVSNQEPSNNKVYQAFSQESDDIWSVDFVSPNGQESNLIVQDFQTRENMHYSNIYNDTNSPGGLIEGDRMRDASMLAKLSIQSNVLTRLFAVNFNIVPSYRSNK